MMGFYPSSDLNHLNEWQQSNAVPPIKDADFSKWQEELGSKALPYGFNTFPIQQTGLDADYMLSVNANNCELLEQLLNTKMGSLRSETDKKIEAFYP
jgi:hypothetical protein